MLSISQPAFSFPCRVNRVPLRLPSRSQRVCDTTPVASLTDSTSLQTSRPFSRRSFLTIATAVAAEACLAKYAVRAETQTIQAFSLPPLPYSYDALEPHISSKIMRAHHDAHFATYVDKLNKAIGQLPPDILISTDQELIELLGNLGSISDDLLKTAVRNNGGGYLNHKQFFSQMASNPSQLPEDTPLALAISRSFDSFDSFKSQFLSKATSLFGSGFTWLVKDKNGSVSIIQTPNQDNPAMQNLKPVLACDCWEHSWYYQYGPKKKDYLDAWWSVVDWSIVNDIFINA